jgi:hypothetical protein
MISPLAEPNRVGDFLSQVRSSAQSLLEGAKRTVKNAFQQPEPLSGLADNQDQVTQLPGGGQRVIFNQGASPTPTATPQPSIPPITPNRVDPYTPQNIPQTYYTNRNQAIVPEWFDSIINSKGTDFQKRLALALLTQESSGGVNLSGDSGGSFGGYHIQPGNSPLVRDQIKDFGKIITAEEANDPKKATEFLMWFLDKMQNKYGFTEDQLLKGNKKVSGWNTGSTNPDYGKDLPQMATTSSFFRR